MCGIAGFAGPGDTGDIRCMTEILRHRGPDGEGYWQDNRDPVYLGHRRLSIIDPACGHQPMMTTGKELVVVFNGEIYNHMSLRKELEKKGHRFATHHSDTEVLLHGYREWADELPSRLNGMWAFAIFDRAKRTLFLSRDRFGKKPLFYTHQKQTFAFSSELTSLARHSKITSNQSLAGLRKYFAYGYIPAPHSLYENIHKLPGGCNLFYNLGNNTLCTQRYWEFSLAPFERLPQNPEAEWGERLRQLLSDAVKRRLIADVPLGVFLSGGIDSSSVATLAVRHSGQNDVQTFSIGFDQTSFDESRYAAQAARLLKTRHYQEILSLDKSAELLPHIITRLDEPMGDSSLLPTYLLCRTARKKVTVALGGDGADELFAGYDPFRALRMAELYAKLVPKPIHQAIRMIMARLPVSHTNMSLDFKIKRTLRGLSYPGALWNPVWLGPLSPGELKELFTEPFDIEEVYADALEMWESIRHRDIVDKTLMFYTRFYLQDDILVKIDRAGMLNSLEVRAPFLDIELVNFVRRIPHAYKFRRGQTKYILKKALTPVLPPQIINRSKKGFGIPIGSWIKNGQFQCNPCTGAKIFNRRFVKSQIHRHCRGIEDHRAFLWNIWLLESWSKHNRGLSSGP